MKIPLQIRPGLINEIAASQEWRVRRQRFAIEQVVAAWPFMRDYVLEEAARACDRFMKTQNQDAVRNRGTNMATYAECHANGAANCAALVRAMKGEP